MIPPDLLMQVDRLEAEAAVRRTTARYFQICDDLNAQTPFDELGELFTSDALWEGRGRYSEAFGAYRGRDAIVDMIRSYCLPQPHFVMTAHFFSSEHIVVDGDTAWGKWLMLQTSTYADDRSDLRSAALALRFARERDVWRIAHFCTRNIFSRRIDGWNDDLKIPVPDAPRTGVKRG